MTEQHKRDHFVTTGAGSIFVRSWSGHGGLIDAPAPILLFHDSLGCIDLWREFPERLAIRTGRPVIAYDRLGFGRSEALLHKAS